MDELDRRILQLLAANARMPVRDIARQVSLTSPAVSSRIRKMEQAGIISGYTVLVDLPKESSRIDAFISLSTPCNRAPQMAALIHRQPQVLQCWHVTGDHSFMVRVSCPDMAHLEHLITDFQKLGQTNTQIILSVPLDRSGVDILTQPEVF